MIKVVKNSSHINKKKKSYYYILDHVINRVLLVMLLHQQVILDRKMIAKHYLRTWFFIDLISVIPIDIIYYAYIQSVGHSGSGRTYLTLRLLRYVFHI